MNRGTIPREVVETAPAGEEKTAAERLRAVASAIAADHGDGVLRLILEEEWRRSTQRGHNLRPLPIGDLEAMLIFLVERIRRDHGIEAMNRLLDDVRTLGEMREARDNRRGH
ncbi:hypothetical protein [Zavarzinia sp.]|uniref:hypothetical protein n=1 Tax=Zavarzinia sp. TaxID=2027920 RepID=UPI003565E0E4